MNAEPMNHPHQRMHPEHLISLASLGRLVAVILLALLCALPQAARAEDSAEDHYRLGAEYYQDGEYESAIREFKAAYAIDPKPQHLFNIGQAYRRLGQASEAVDAFERYLRLEPNPDPTVQADLQSYIGRVLGVQTEQGDKSPDRPTEPEPAPYLLAEESADAEELFDRVVHENQSGNLAVSNELLSQLREVHRQRRDPVILFYMARAFEKMGKKKEALESYRAYLGSEGTDQQRRAQATEKVILLTPPPPGRKYLWASLGLGLAGVAGLVTGVGLWAQASSTLNQFQQPQSEQQKRDLRSFGQNLGLGSVIAYSAGGAFAVTGAALLGVALYKGVRRKNEELPRPPSERRSGRLSLLPGESSPGSVASSLRLRLGPMSLGLQGEF